MVGRVLVKNEDIGKAGADEVEECTKDPTSE